MILGQGFRRRQNNFWQRFLDRAAIFSLTSAGKFTTLYTFCPQNNCPDGAYPYGLVQATDGNFYGTTSQGGLSADGTSNGGTIFKLTPSGKLTTLYAFCGKTNCTDGTMPRGLVQDTSGIFWGVTEAEGQDLYGTAYTLATGLAPFVETLPTSGKVGATVIILGSSLTGTTSVTFNGTTATFTVVSATEIRTAVPTGATTGKVKVVTPSRTLTSNVAFRVP